MRRNANRDFLFVSIVWKLQSTKQKVHVWCMHVLYVCVHSHLSWGALLYRLDDGDSVPLFQGKAAASITGPYLERKKHTTSPISKIPSQQTKTFSQSTNTHTRSRYWYRQIAAMVVFAHSSEKNAYWGIKWTFAVL